MNLLSIQSHVAYGHVGNAAAVFALQRIGVEVWPVHTVQFSNHTGYGRWRGRVFDGEAIRDVVEGIAERGVLGECDGVSPATWATPESATRSSTRSRGSETANPAARYCCDPVIGDVGRGVFVRDGIAEFMRECAVPAADIVTPNQFELDYLSRRHAARPCTMLLLPSTPCMRLGRASCWSPRCIPTRRRRMRSILSPRTAASASVCARRSCRSRSTARATRSRRCSSRMRCAPARPRRRSRLPPPRCSACSARTLEAGVARARAHRRAGRAGSTEPQRFEPLRL